MKANFCMPLIKKSGTHKIIMQDSKFANIKLQFDKKRVYEEVNLNAFSMPSGNS